MMGVVAIRSVADVMRTHVYRVTPGTNVRSAANELIAHGIESLLVVEESRVIGIVAERDLLAAILPSPEEVMRSDGVSGFSDLIEIARERFHVPVTQVMTRSVQTIASTDSITKALGRMLAHRLRRLAVLEPDSGELVGVITQRDLLSVIFLDRSHVPHQSIGSARLGR